ncbi:hypothetical protein [Erwinia mallotivora]|uniref:hypothetical protein n=1 Tax=Erwinia mallotivora TaxID=69222 RepID=UPI0021C1CE7C|nr:hypothetical protein [Erwinia mallotivora]
MASAECRRHFRRRGESGATGTVAASVVLTLRQGMEARRAETVYRLRLRQPPVPGGKSPGPGTHPAGTSRTEIPRTGTIITRAGAYEALTPDKDG